MDDAVRELAEKMVSFLETGTAPEGLFAPDAFLDLRLGGLHVAWAALAGLCRQLAAEFGPYGVRVNWLLSPGSPGYDEHDQQPESPASGETVAAPGSAGLLARHLPSYDEVANVAVFAASDWARTITASEINFTGGAVVD
jgi:NAD(P)-dependent dehydrogenase (short-subunit alcohol dehydrogenase family)